MANICSLVYDSSIIDTQRELFPIALYINLSPSCPPKGKKIVHSILFDWNCLLSEFMLLELCWVTRVMGQLK